jgi:hypothetical protein
MKLLRKTIRRIMLEGFKVRGYVKPASSFKPLHEWEAFVLRMIELQSIGLDTRGGEISCKHPRFCNTADFEEFTSLIVEFFGFQMRTEVERYELLTLKNMLDFIEDFINHRFWALKKQYSSYVSDIDSLKFAYFYSRGDIEPYVLLDENWTNQIYGPTDVVKEVKHFTSEEGLQNLMQAIESGMSFDISTFTDAKKQFFDQNSTLIVTIEGVVRAAFRSDVKSFATDSGRRAMNLYRLDYPGDDLTNICYDLEDCGPERTFLWNELIVTPMNILKVETN